MKSKSWAPTGVRHGVEDEGGQARGEFWNEWAPGGVANLAARVRRRELCPSGPNEMDVAGSCWRSRAVLGQRNGGVYRIQGCH